MFWRVHKRGSTLAMCRPHLLLCDTDDTMIPHRWTVDGWDRRRLQHMDTDTDNRQSRERSKRANGVRITGLLASPKFKSRLRFQEGTYSVSRYCLNQHHARTCIFFAGSCGGDKRSGSFPAHRPKSTSRFSAEFQHSVSTNSSSRRRDGRGCRNGRRNLLRRERRGDDRRKCGPSSGVHFRTRRVSACGR